MRFRLDSQTGPDVPTPAKALDQIHSRLAPIKPPVPQKAVA
jgi:hypothetical protein